MTGSGNFPSGRALRPEVRMNKEQEEAVRLTTKERIAQMSPEQKEEALFNLLRFMCSDDDGNWDEAKADRLQRACAKAAKECP